MEHLKSSSLRSPEEQHLLYSTDSSYDSELWITAHTQLLTQRNHDITELSKDLTLLNEMYRDLNLRVESHQDDLDLLQHNVIQTENKVKIANKEISFAQAAKSSNFSLKLIILGIVATGITAGAGGISFLIGVKPLTALLISSGCSLVAIRAAIGGT